MFGQVPAAMSATPPHLDKLSAVKNMTLNEKLAILNKLDPEIVELTEENDLEDEIKQADEYTESTYERLTHINNTFAAATAPSVPHMSLQCPPPHLLLVPSARLNFQESLYLISMAVC